MAMAMAMDTSSENGSSTWATTVFHAHGTPIPSLAACGNPYQLLFLAEERIVTLMTTTPLPRRMMSMILPTVYLRRDQKDIHKRNYCICLSDSFYGCRSSYLCSCKLNLELTREHLLIACQRCNTYNASILRREIVIMGRHCI